MNPLSGGLLWKLQKNRNLVDALITRRAPDFVVQRAPPDILDHVPVFTFHVAIPERFDRQCQHLANSGFRTIDSDELKGIMLGEIKQQPRSCMLTFDDGLKQVWTVAYPILKKYGLRATVFLVPGCMSDASSTPRKTLEHVWRGEATEGEVFGIAPGESALASWAEVAEMHESGVMDFQSHTMWHSLVHKSADLIDFGRPDYNCHYFGNIHVPMYQQQGVDKTDRELVLGMPIYSAAPRMQVGSRFFDDEGVREHCVDLVSANGGESFFENRNWRKIMARAFRTYKKKNPVNERFEKLSDRDIAIRKELREAKEIIESQLPGKSVEHLCFPWYRGAEFAVDCASETGHFLTYYDAEPGFIVNVPGTSDKITRVDETFLRRLPGEDRMSKRDVIKEVLGLRQLPTRMFPC